MAKVSSIQKNINRRELVKKFKNKRLLLKNKIKQKNLSMEERLILQKKLNELPRNTSSIRVRNRCELTGRPRGVYRKFRMSRIAVRGLASTGYVPGMVKSSW